MTDFAKLLNNALFTREYFQQEDICRLCWSKDASNVLFSRMIFCTLKSPLFFKVQSCLGIDLSEDDSEYHPRKICEKCFLKIEQFNDFKAFCQNSNQKLNAIINITENTESLKIENDPIKIEKNEGDIDIIDLIDAESLVSFPGSLNNFDTEVESFETHVEENITETSNIFNLNITESSLPPANQPNQVNNSKPSQTPVETEIPFVRAKPTCCSKNVSELAPKKTTSTLSRNYERANYCNTCFIDFKHEEAYLNHNSEAHGIERNGKFRCFGCGKLYNNRKTRFSHESYSCNSLELGFKCNICSRYLPLRGSYDRHINDHRFNSVKDEPDNSGGIFKCYMCDERFTRRSKWCGHMTTHKSEDRKGKTCKTTTITPNKREAKKKENKELKPKPILDNKETSSPKAHVSPLRGARTFPGETSSSKISHRFRPTTYCNICLIDLKDEKALLIHNSKVHGKERDGKYRCFGCGKLLHNGAARLRHENHMCAELEYGFKCNICGRKLPFRGSYERHLYQHRRNRVEDLPDDSGGIFKCNKCDERFPRRSVWHKHIVKHKREGILAKVSETTSKQTQKSITINRKDYERSPTYCNTCFIDLRDKEAYLVHNSEVHGIERDGKFRCFGCGKLFNHRRARVSHEGYSSCSSLEFGFKCNICGRHLPLRGSYEKHLNHHRLNKIKDLPDDSGGIFKCDKCSERFTRRSVWYKHLLEHRKKGKKQEAFICETCGKVFARQTNLDIHAAIHSGIKRYKCDLCDYRATQKTNLTIHMRKHTNERPYACDLCPQRCVSASNLLAHKRRHLGIRRFQCAYCNKKFAYKQTMSDHIAIIHQKLQRYICQICGAEYARNNGLRRHVRKKHPDDHYLDKQKPTNHADPNIADERTSSLDLNNGDENGQGMLCPNDVPEKIGQEVLYPNNDRDENERTYSNVNQDLSKDCELQRDSDLNVPQQGDALLNLNIGENEKFVCFEKSFCTKDGENVVIVLQEQE